MHNICVCNYPAKKILQFISCVVYTLSVHGQGACTSQVLIGIYIGGPAVYAVPVVDLYNWSLWQYPAVCIELCTSKASFSF